MITNISYNVLIERFRAFAEGHFLIKGFTHGDPSNVNIEKGVEFPWMHVFPVEVAPQSGSRLYSFIITFADLPRDKETPPEYQREMLSDCIRLAEDLLAEIQNGLTLFGPNVEIDGAANIECFINEFSHTLTGVNLSLTLSVPWNWSACDIPADWSVGGSGSGGSGAGLGLILETNGVLNGDQGLLNLQQGTNITLVDNGNGTVTISSTGGGGGGGSVTSVALTMPSGFVVSGSPITTNGTLAITGAGTSADYIDGTGAVQTFPAIPAAQVNSDWNAVSGVAEILNKPTIPSPQGLQDVITTNNNLTTNNSIVGNSTNLVWQNNVEFKIYPTAAGFFEVFLGKYPPSESRLYITAIDASMKTKGVTTQEFKTDSTTLYIKTPAVGNGTATVGQALTLANASTGAVEFTTVGGGGGGTVTSVGLSLPAPVNPAFSVSGSPVTTSGTLAISANGTSSQYVDGTGALQTMPTTGIKSATASGTDTYAVTITGVGSYVDGEAYLVRFTNGNTDASTLNINGLGAISLYRNNDGPLIGGDIWDGAEMLCIYNSGLNGFQCIGASPNSLFAYITNAESTTITKGQAVYAFSGTGNRMTVKLAKADADATSAQTIGIVYSDSIAANQKGIIIIQGYLTGLSLFPTSTWADGDPIYLSPTTAGAFTKTKPLAPNHLVYCGILATASNGSSGRMYVRIQNGYEMDELHDVQSSGAVNNDILYRDTAASLWKPASIPTILGYTPVTNARTISTTSPLSGGGDLTANRTLSIADAMADGATKGAAAFTASDFNSASGVISLDYTNGQKASAAQPGFLTAADWSTFNSKVGTDSVVFASNPNISQGANSTAYWAITGGAASNATENARVVVMPCAGTLKNLYIRIGAAQSSGGTMVFTLRKNAADTAITVTFANADGSNVTKSDTVNSVSVNAGDTITIKGVNNAPSSASGTFVSFSIILERS